MNLCQVQPKPNCGRPGTQPAQQYSSNSGSCHCPMASLEASPTGLLVAGAKGSNCSISIIYSKSQGQEGDDAGYQWLALWASFYNV